MRNFLTSALLGAVLLMLPNYSQAEIYLLRMGGGHTKGLTYISVFDDFFVKEVQQRVREKTGDEIRFITAWGGSAAKVDGGIEAVHIGALDIALSPIGFEQSRAALLNYSAMVPFTTDDPVLQGRVATRMLNEVPALQESMQPYNAYILAQMVTEAYGLSTTFELNSPKDVHGKRIAMAGSNVRLFKPLETVPLNLGVGEHYQAMQTGLADGSLFFISGMEAFRFKEVASRFTRTGFGSLSTFVAFMNIRTRERLPEQIVQIIDEVAGEAAVIVAEKSRQRDADLARTLGEQGIQITDLSEQARREWANSLINMPRQYIEDLQERDLPTREVLETYIRILSEEGYDFPVEYPL